MATYVNDLRLKEIATGDEAGTWGTSTNTNLELIAEAFSFGTEAITTNADTHTTTIADGSTDPGRSIYLKYTGTLDSACTITIGPNTVSKLWFIENGTSGSQNIIISQGSGANITIPAGDVKAVYSDGAGSGAAIVDAFASLNVVDLKVEDDLTVTDDVAIGGLATVGGTLGVTGVVTANAGVVVDNITIDGQEIDVSSGNLTLDVAGEIKLDSDDGVWRFQDNGGSLIELSTGSGSSPTFFTAVSDADLVFRGNDGGSAITALTLDMSEAGAATFNGKITADAGIDIDNINIDGTTIALAGSSDLTIDVGGRIDLSADDNGEIRLYDGSSLYGQFKDDSDRLTIQGKIADADMMFTVIDGSSEVTALRIDASDAGKSIFSRGILFNADTAAANELDDYEEGTWTPVLIGSDTQSGQAYSTQQGTYTKIGRQVNCQFNVNLSTEGTFGNNYILLSGFPFTISSSVNTVHLTNLYFVGMATNYISIGLQAFEGNSKAYLWAKKSASASREYVGLTDLTDSTQLTGQFTYFI